MGFVELSLWLAFAWFSALVYFEEAALAVVALAGIVVLILALGRQRVGRHGSWPSWVASAAVFPAAWALLQLLAYGVAVGWQWLAA
jgi:hypothetical protein